VEGTGQPATQSANDGINEAIELGATLKEMRLALKRDLDDIAEELRIRRGYLEAIEEGRFSDLPGATYALGFVKAYAETLGFDASDAARRFKSAVGGGTPQPNLILPAPVPSGGLPTGAVLLVAATLAVLVYGAWYVMSTEGHDPGAMVATLPGRVADVVRNAMPEREAEPREAMPRGAVAIRPLPVPAAEEPAAPTGESAPTAPAAPATAASGVSPSPPPVASTQPPAASVPPSTTTAAADEADQDIDEDEDTPPPPPEQVVNETPPPPPSAQPPKPAPASAAASGGSASKPPAPAATSTSALTPPPLATAAAKPPAALSPSPASNSAVSQQAALPASPAAASAAPSGAHRIVLIARADSWVELRDPSGASVYSRVLRKDERYEVPERQGLVMMTGNAGGVEVLVDGRAVPALGSSGAVKRNIVMDPDRLLAGTAVPPSPPPVEAQPVPPQSATPTP